VLHVSSLIRFVATNAIFVERHNSFLGHNALYCANKYNRSLNDLIFGGSDCCVKLFYHGSVDCEQALRADFLCELIAIRDRRLVLCNGYSFTVSELRDIILYVCTS
jgi:hypothetical protein